MVVILTGVGFYSSFLFEPQKYSRDQKKGVAVSQEPKCSFANRSGLFGKGRIFLFTVKPWKWDDFHSIDQSFLVLRGFTWHLFWIFGCFLSKPIRLRIQDKRGRAMFIEITSCINFKTRKIIWIYCSFLISVSWEDLHESNLNENRGEWVEYCLFGGIRKVTEDLRGKPKSWKCPLMLWINPFLHHYACGQSLPQKTDGCVNKIITLNRTKKSQKCTTRFLGKYILNNETSTIMHF